MPLYKVKTPIKMGEHIIYPEDGKLISMEESAAETMPWALDLCPPEEDLPVEETPEDEGELFIAEEDEDDDLVEETPEEDEVEEEVEDSTSPAVSSATNGTAEKKKIRKKK